MKQLVIATALTAMGTAVLAGSASPPPVKPVVASAPPPVADLGGDWTGGYAGLSLGNADISGDVSGDDFTYGIHGGYNYDFGQFVVGGELELDGMDVNLGGGASVDRVARLKLKGGYDLGRTLIYVTAGLAEVDTTVGSETGGFGGIGANYMVNDQFYVGGEILEHDFNDIAGSGLDADATTISIRGGLRF